MYATHLRFREMHLRIYGGVSFCMQIMCTHISHVCVEVLVREFHLKGYFIHGRNWTGAWRTLRCSLLA